MTTVGGHLSVNHFMRASEMGNKVQLSDNNQYLIAKAHGGHVGRRAGPSKNRTEASKKLNSDTIQAFKKALTKQFGSKIAKTVFRRTDLKDRLDRGRPLTSRVIKSSVKLARKEFELHPPKLHQHTHVHQHHHHKQHNHSISDTKPGYLDTNVEPEKIENKKRITIDDQGKPEKSEKQEKLENKSHIRLEEQTKSQKQEIDEKIETKTRDTGKLEKKPLTESMKELLALWDKEVKSYDTNYLKQIDNMAPRDFREFFRPDKPDYDDIFNSRLLKKANKINGKSYFKETTGINVDKNSYIKQILGDERLQDATAKMLYCLENAIDISNEVIELSEKRMDTTSDFSSEDMHMLKEGTDTLRTLENNAIYIIQDIIEKRSETIIEFLRQDISEGSPLQKQFNNALKTIDEIIVKLCKTSNSVSIPNSTKPNIGELATVAVALTELKQTTENQYLKDITNFSTLETLLDDMYGVLFPEEVGLEVLDEDVATDKLDSIKLGLLEEVQSMHNKLALETIRQGDSGTNEALDEAKDFVARLSSAVLHAIVRTNVQ